MLLRVTTESILVKLPAISWFEIATASSRTASGLLVLYKSGFAPRWYVPRADIDESALSFVEHQTFCPYKGLCSYYDIGGARLAAWSYREAYPEVARISGLISFEPDLVSVYLDDTQLRLEPGQAAVPHGPDRELSIAEATPRQ